MKLAGHTHAFREVGLDVFTTVDRIAALGFDGIEVAARPGVFTVEASPQQRADLRAHIARSGLELVNIACYSGGEEHGLNAADGSVRAAAERGIEKHLHLAADLGSPCVRVFPGGEPGHDGVRADPRRALEMSVSGIQRLATLAMDLGVTLLIENHPYSIAGSAEQTVRIVEAVARPNVRILYEPSNLLVYAGRDDHHHGFDIQKLWIHHVHIKDHIRKPDGTYDAAVPGRGIMPWPDILAWLVSATYHSFLTLELAWTDDLENRQSELEEGLAHLRSLIEAAG